MNAPFLNQPFWSLAQNEALRALKTSVEGLDIEEVKIRQKSFGPNIIEERRRLRSWRLLFNQAKSPLILVLVAAGFITAVLQHWVDTSVIFAAVTVNVLLGFWQENKAEGALDLLKSYIRTRARVRRGNREYEIDAAELVPGDIIRVSQGDRIPADARLIFINDLEVDEAILTGESLPVSKRIMPLPVGTGLAERTSMIFSGTLVVHGFADGVVSVTGAHTEFGKIAHLVAERRREPTPLERSIGRFTLRAGFVLAVLVISIFGLGLYVGQAVFDMFLIAVAIAVSVVPEGLPIAVTVILAVGVQRLAGKKGVVRRLLAAETLGSASIILTDKTGTLTQAKMELAAVVPFGSRGKDAEKRVLREALFNTDIVIENPDDPADRWNIIGRPIEVALIRGAARYGILAPEFFSNVKTIDQVPFSSETKFSISLSHFDGKRQLTFWGAPDILLEYCEVQADDRPAILNEIEKRAFAGERVLGVAIKDFSASEDKIPEDFTKAKLSFLGLITFRDPLRPHARAAIVRVREAGVKTVIVTGDHQGTAEAVARELGLVDGKGAVLTGNDLQYLSPEELGARSDEVTVYARVTPEQKMKLVKLYQKKGEVVAVTGDGINDAPALEIADIGIAMGSGTDVAKSAADLVILDDNFETIVSAIEEGRRVIGNIRKVIVYLLSDSLNELFLIGGALVIGVALPLNALQILFVNFFSDSFPAIALAFEKGIDGFGSKPKKLDRNLFDREMQVLILVIGVLVSALLFTLYALLLSLGFEENTVRTFIFAAFASYTLLLAFSVRSLDKSIFSYNLFSNLYLVAGIGVGIFLTVLAVYAPFFQRIFGTVALSPLWVLGVMGVGILNIAAVEITKWFFRKRN